MEIFSEYWGLTKKQTQELVKDGIVSIREFGARQVLMGMDGDPDEIGVVLSGVALLESTNLEEQRRILDFYEERELFWRRGFPDLERGLYYMISRSKCRVAFMNYEKLLSWHGDYSGWFGILERGILKAQQKSMIHVDILGQRTMRQKLLAFFAYRSRETGRNTFTLPFSLTDCADYLAVDRSAMMRELGKMKEEGLVKTQGRRVELTGRKGQQA